jgi:hypothetical protein
MLLEVFLRNDILGKRTEGSIVGEGSGVETNEAHA